MEDDIPVAHCGADAVGIGDVAGDDFHVAAEFRLVEPAAASQGIVMHHGPYPRALANEAFRQVAANEAAGAGDEDLSPRQAHWATFWAVVIHNSMVRVIPPGNTRKFPG